MRFFLTPHSAVKLKWQKFFPISRNLRKKRQTSDQFFFLIKHNKSFRTKYLSKSLFMFLLSFGLVKSNTKFWLGSTFAIISSFFYNILPIYHQHHVSSSSPSVSLQKTKCVQKTFQKERVKSTHYFISNVLTNISNNYLHHLAILKKKYKKLLHLKLEKKE